MQSTHYDIRLGSMIECVCGKHPAFDSNDPNYITQELTFFIDGCMIAGGMSECGLAVGLHCVCGWANAILALYVPEAAGRR